MPRMKPQPHNVSMMIFRRRERYQKAVDLLELKRLADSHPGDPMLRGVLKSASFSLFSSFAAFFSSPFSLSCPVSLFL